MTAHPGYGYVAFNSKDYAALDFSTAYRVLIRLTLHVGGRDYASNFKALRSETCLANTCARAVLNIHYQGITFGYFGQREDRVTNTRHLLDSLARCTAIMALIAIR